MTRAPRDLSTFVARLRAAGELVEVDAPVDPRLEVAEIHRRVIAANGPALLFTRVKDRDFPLATNLFGTRRRVELAFGDEPPQLVARAVELARGEIPPKLSRLWQERDLFARLARLGPRVHGRGPLLDHVQAPPRLDRLPALTTWARDGGRSLPCHPS